MAALIWNEFAPDLDSLTPGNITAMRKFRPTEKGVATVSPMSVLCSSLPSTCYGAFVAYLLGTQCILLCTINGVYIALGGHPSPLGTGFLNSVNRWRAAPYGQYFILANGVDPTQYYNNSTNLLLPLTGSPPIASLVASTDYAVILVPPNSQTLYSNLAPTASWTPNGPSQVYQYTLAQLAGNITSVQRKRSLLAVYRQNAIQAATFVGNLIGWDFGSPGTVSTTVGVKSNEMLINTGDIDYFVGPDDFWSFDGYNLNRVPNHVKEWFFGNGVKQGDLNQPFAQNMVGHFDNINDLIMWHYPSNATARGQAGMIDSVIGFYNRGAQPRWFMDRLDLDYALTGTALNTHGVIATDHSLMVNDDTAPLSIISDMYVTSQDFGDRQHVWQTTRIMPGFTTYPVPTTSSPPARILPLVQMKVGTAPVPKVGKAISDDGWFNIVTTGRLTRWQLKVYGPCEQSAGNVETYITGEV